MFWGLLEIKHCQVSYCSPSGLRLIRLALTVCRWSYSCYNTACAVRSFWRDWGRIW